MDEITSNITPLAPSGTEEGLHRPTPPDVLKALEKDAEEGRAALDSLDPMLADAVGFTHFDTPASEDNHITVLLDRRDLLKLASQTLVRIKSVEDQRKYLGVVVKGPFSEADAVPPNSSMAIGVTVQGKKVQYTFDYHGRAEVEILGEELDGGVIAPRYRPRPKSPVFLLTEPESESVLGLKGNLVLGQVVGYEDMKVRIDPREKSVLPRHTAILGTTGGGKSTTIATFVHKLQENASATIIFDVEGEYTHLNEPTDQPQMVLALQRQGRVPEGVKDLHILHLHGKDSSNPGHKKRTTFDLTFSSISPYAIAEILEMPEAQQERFLTAYDVARRLLGALKIFPSNPDEEALAQDYDELSAGYPQMTLQHLLDVVNVFIYRLGDGKTDSQEKKGKKKSSENAEEVSDTPETTFSLPLYSTFNTDPKKVFQAVQAVQTSNKFSWLGLYGRLNRLRRLRIFDVPGVRKVDYSALLQPGRVTVIDLSDTDSPQLNNLVIADLLRGIQDEQEKAITASAAEKRPATPIQIIIEEAHEFLSASRITQMPVLFQQVARIARRGRKRWLGLIFVTQSPQHLPNEVLGLINNFVIHKISDASVINRLQKAFGNVDESLWRRVTRLAPGQALVSFSGFSRPLLAVIDPAPCKRLLVE